MLTANAERIVSQRARINDALKASFEKFIDHAVWPGALSKDPGEPLPLNPEAIDKLHLARGTWPLEFKHASTLRSVLHAFHSQGDLEIHAHFGPFALRDRIEASRLRTIVKALNLQATGICVHCVPATSEACICKTPSSNVRRLAASDPISDWMEQSEVH